VRVLHSLTLVQWGCIHRWKTTTTRPGQDDVVRMRYLTCRRCGLKVKSEERLAVPWDEDDLVEQVKALLPEGQAVALGDKGITELPLARLNDRLAPQGYAVRAKKGRDRTRQVACMDHDGRVTPYAWFELRPLAAEASGQTSCKEQEEKTLCRPPGPKAAAREAGLMPRSCAPVAGRTSDITGGVLYTHVSTRDQG
jgi:hypothetical protein